MSWISNFKVYAEEIKQSCAEFLDEEMKLVVQKLSVKYNFDLTKALKFLEVEAELEVKKELEKLALEKADSNLAKKLNMLAKLEEVFEPEAPVKKSELPVPVPVKKAPVKKAPVKKAPETEEEKSTKALEKKKKDEEKALEKTKKDEEKAI